MGGRGALSLRFALAASVGAALGTTGCFAVNDPAAHLPDAVPAEDFCADFAEVICEAAVDCCAGSAVPRAECVETLDLYCTRVYGAPTIDARAAYDQDEAAVQLAIGRSLVDRCDPGFFIWVLSRGGLAGAFRGTVPPGGSCAPRFEEVPGMEDLPRFYVCVDEGRCGEAFTCEATVGEGGSCLGGECASGLACVGSAGETRGTCGRGAVEIHGLCDEVTDCASGYCQAGLNTGHCLPSPEAYCATLRACETQRIAYGPEAGPVAVGGTCELLAMCLESQAQADAVAELSPGILCAETMADGLCYDASGLYPVTCGFAPGTLDAEAVAELCAITVRLAALDEDEPVGETLSTPFLVCFDAP